MSSFDLLGRGNFVLNLENWKWVLSNLNYYNGALPLTLQLCNNLQFLQLLNFLKSIFWVLWVIVFSEVKPSSIFCWSCSTLSKIVKYSLVCAPLPSRWVMTPYTHIFALTQWTFTFLQKWSWLNKRAGESSNTQFKYTSVLNTLGRARRYGLKCVLQSKGSWVL